MGRESELAAVGGLLRQPSVPLVTLIGPGGVETRRATRSPLLDAGPDFPDGVRFVALAPVTDPASVPAAIAAALGVRESSDGPLVDRIVAFLEDRTALLLLDNFEGVAAAAGIVATLIFHLSPPDGAGHKPRRPERVGRASVPGAAAGVARPGACHAGRRR